MEEKWITLYMAAKKYGLFYSRLYSLVKSKKLASSYLQDGTIIVKDLDVAALAAKVVRRKRKAKEIVINSEDL